MSSFRRSRRDFLGHACKMYEEPAWFCPSCHYTVAADDEHKHIVDGNEIYLHKNCLDQYMSKLLRQALMIQEQAPILKDLERILEKHA